MKAAVYEGGQRIVIRDVEKPRIFDNQVLIKVKYCGICGADLFIASGNHPRIKTPTIIGHEFAGEIVAINQLKGPKNLQTGDRVAVKPTYSCKECSTCKAGYFHVCKNIGLFGIDQDGGFAEFVKVPIENVIKVSDQVNYEEIAITEPLAVALHSIRRSRFRIGDRVIILGGGPIGLLIGLLLKLAGASLIIISEVNPFRIKIIKEMGLIPVNPLKDDLSSIVKEKTAGDGFDILFEAAGVLATSKQMVEFTKIRGQIVIVGLFEEGADCDFRNLALKEQDIVGVRVYTEDDINKAVKMLETQQINVKPLITNKLKLEELNKGIEMIGNKDDVFKILISPER